MPALARLALVLLLANAWEEIRGISVPTGKLTPITPAKVTPRPTYHPPAAAPAPVHEYTFDNPEPAPLNPSWVPVPVKYLNVLRANSILYVPIRIPNPNYYNMALKEQPAATTEATTYQNQDAAVYQTQQSNSAVYQTQQPTAAVYQNQQPTAAVYQAQQPTTYQAQQPNTGVYQAQQVNNAVYQSQAAPAVYQSQPTNAPVAQTTYQPVKASSASTYQKESDNGKETEQVPEFGAKIAPKQKYNKPYYYLPKSQYGKQATKGGYPKKAIAAPSQKYYFYYPVPTNAQ